MELHRLQPVNMTNMSDVDVVPSIKCLNGTEDLAFIVRLSQHENWVTVRVTEQSCMIDPGQPRLVQLTSTEVGAFLKREILKGGTVLLLRSLMVSICTMLIL